MPILLLSRPKALTVAEKKLLPKGCVATDGDGGVVARADVDLPLGGLLGYAFALGRAVPDAFFSVQDLPAVAAPGAPDPEAPAARAPAAPAPTAPAAALPAPASAPPPADDVITETDPWKLVAAGQIAQAERVFSAGNGLDSAGRDRCRALLNSRTPEDAALGCRIARMTGWRSIVINLKPLLAHAHPEVRRDAAAAIGALAGPSMAAVLRPLLNDPDAEVKKAAGEALAKLGG
jgi:hypothetical protein